MDYNTPIDSAGFSVRTFNAIKRAFPGVNTLGELRQAMANEKATRNLGRNSLSEINEALAAISKTETVAPAQQPMHGLSTGTQSTQVSDSYAEAVTCHTAILSGIQLASQGLYQMAQGFKRMRDGKLYKELGYKSFEEYCEAETGMNRRNVYKYITIAEKIPEDFVSSKTQIGKEKLLLLTTLTDDQREEIAENTDLESTSVKELKRQIDELTGKNKELREDLENSELINKQYQSEIEDLTGDNTDLEEERDKLLVELRQAQSEAREVIVTDPTESEEYKALQKKCTHLENELLAVPSPKVNYDEVDRRVTEAVDKMNHEYQLKFSEQQKNLAQMTQEKNEHIYELQDKIKELEQKQTLTGYFLPVSIEDYSAICKLLKGTKYEKMIYSAKLVKF
jgi:DNA repair exonuclease SbcCD ATPase subunit